MSFDGKIGNLSVKERTIVTMDHPSVLLTGLLEPGTGDLPGGTILTRGDELELYPWDGKTGIPVGVLAADTQTGASALYLAHGTVALESLKLAGGLPATAAEIYALAKAGVYGV